MDADFFHKLKGVYFPLARFGKYVVIVRNAKDQVESVSRAETMAEAQALREELINKYPNSKVDKVVLDKDYNASRDMVGRGFMSNLYNELDNLGISASEKAQLEDTLAQLYLSSLPDLSWAKHGIHRKGTAGFSQDARRAFAQNMFHGAGYLAKLRYSDLLDEQLSDMQKYADEQAKDNPEYDQPTAQRVINEMNMRHQNLMNPKSNPLSSTLTSVGFLYYLGLSPASAVVNLLQTPLVTLPVMAAKWNLKKSSQALIKASEEAVKAKNDMSKVLTGDELQAYNEAVSRGVIDVTQAHDLAGIAQGEDSGVMWKLRPVMRWASFLFHHAERFNRSATFMASYRLAKESGATHAEAFDQAADVTYQSHFDYSSGNRPRLMQGNVAKVIFLFKQFGQNMIYLLTRQAYQAIKAEKPEDRIQARKTLAGLLTTHALASGVLGLPLVGMLLAGASMIGGSDDEPWDAEVALRNMLADMFGNTVSNMIAKGVSRATPWDISGRVGLSSLILPDVQEGLEGQRWAESAMAGALGPVAGIGTGILKGMNNIGDGNFERGLEDMLPVSLKSPLKSMRYQMEGAQDKTGISILDEVGTMAIVGQTLGFSPSDVRTASDGKSAIYQMNQRLQARRSQLLAQFSRAKMNDDEETLSEVWADIDKFNAKNPSRRITKPNAMQSYRNRMRRINHSENGVYIPKKHHEVLDEGRFAFSE
ncbi:PLxRFG domain-containing protein [Acinetobacter sp. ANC 5383]